MSFVSDWVSVVVYCNTWFQNGPWFFTTFQVVSAVSIQLHILMSFEVRWNASVLCVSFYLRKKCSSILILVWKCQNSSDICKTDRIGKERIISVRSWFVCMCEKIFHKHNQYVWNNWSWMIVKLPHNYPQKKEEIQKRRKKREQRPLQRRQQQQQQVFNSIYKHQLKHVGNEKGWIHFTLPIFKCDLYTVCCDHCVFAERLQCEWH